MPVMDSKFSNFNDGGDLETNDLVVGLRDGLNTRFTYNPSPSGVVSIGAGDGIATSPDPITSTGTISLAPIADDRVMANISGGPAAPSANTMSAIIDACIGSTQGDILYRNVSEWIVLPPGTNGQFLKTQGAAANPTWASELGTVSSVGTGAGLTGGTITTTGTISFATVADLRILANISGGVAVPVPNTLTAIIDATIGNVQGDILYRDAATWAVLPPGTNGFFLKTQGAGANPVWAAETGTGSVTSLTEGTEIDLTPNTITTTGSIALAAIADHTLLANISGGALAPSSTTLTALIDNAIGSTQGQILYRNSTVWTVLNPGTSGQFLQTQGAAANPQWAPGDGAGTVTSIATNNGITGGTITSSGTVGLASIADHTLLANISGGSTFPSSTTLTALIDNAIGSTQGDILYRDSSVWSVLAPGTNGNFLQTQGAGANPQWAAGGSSGVTSVDTAGLATGGPITTTGTVTVTAAVKADQETATSTAVAVVPGVQQFHPSAAKAWINFNGTGTIAINGSYNITSITDNGPGNYTITINVDFSGTNYCISLGSNNASGLAGIYIYANVAAGSFDFLNYTCASSTSTTKSARDDTIICASCFGDQ